MKEYILIYEEPYNTEQIVAGYFDTLEDALEWAKDELEGYTIHIYRLADEGADLAL